MSLVFCDDELAKERYIFDGRKGTRIIQEATHLIDRRFGTKSALPCILINPVMGNKSRFGCQVPFYHEEY